MVFNGVFMKKLAIIFILMIGLSFVSFAQKKDGKDAKQEQIVLKPIFEINDIIFALQQLNSVEIVGSEVDAFLECKELLSKTYKTEAEAQKKPTDKVTVDMPAIIAQNTLNFVSRTKFSGGLAERYKSFSDAIFKAAEPYKKKD
jgi:hypothetical protein